MRTPTDRTRQTDLTGGGAPDASGTSGHPKGAVTPPTDTGSEPGTDAGTDHGTEDGADDRTDGAGPSAGTKAPAKTKTGTKTGKEGADVDLRHHGDTEVGGGLVDLAVNVRWGTPPPWLMRRLVTALGDLAAYPDGRAARKAVADRHGRPVEEVLLTAGAAEAFVLLARALSPRRAVVVHPQFTEPEAALRDAGHPVERVLLRPEHGFRLTAPPAPSPRSRPASGTTPDTATGPASDPAPVSDSATGTPPNAHTTPGTGPGPAASTGAAPTTASGPDSPPPTNSLVPDDADLVIIGNPTNPTSVLHPSSSIAALARPGRTLVVDEAFMDTVPGESQSLAENRGTPGLVVLRSLTKTWGLAGLRVGYVLADAGTIRRLERAQPLWPVSTPALAAAQACCSTAALAEAEQAARRLTADRAHLLALLGRLDSVEVHGSPAASFVLVRVRALDTDRGTDEEGAVSNGEGGPAEGDEDTESGTDRPDRADRRTYNAPSAHGGNAHGGRDGAIGTAVRERLRRRGFAVRRGDTFPGLGPQWLRIAVRDRSTTDRFTAALADVLSELRPTPCTGRARPPRPPRADRRQAR